MPAHHVCSFGDFLQQDHQLILGALTAGNATAGFDGRRSQVSAWQLTLDVLREAVARVLQDADCASWALLFEYEIPLRQKRPDVVVLAHDLVFVLEFKTGAATHSLADQRQVEAYCLDLRDFHAESHSRTIIPVLVACQAGSGAELPPPRPEPVQGVVSAASADLGPLLLAAFAVYHQPAAPPVDPERWNTSAYRPVPTILQAAEALYAGHSVREISRAHAANLTRTADYLLQTIQACAEKHQKRICFVTGIPGAGKTLSGLNLVHAPELSTRGAGTATFLSGNGPLVQIMREALARDERERTGTGLGETRRRVSTFIQNVHHFMRQYTQDSPTEVPYHRVVVFDEAQRAWNAEQAARKFGRADSEPMEMLSVMDRHRDWAIIVALVGGGQEINTGEAGLAEWGRALAASFPHWHVAVSPEALHGGESIAGTALFPDGVPGGLAVDTEPALHLDVSLRSWRAEALTSWVNALLVGDSTRARGLMGQMADFPVAVTRSLAEARGWLRSVTRGDRRCGLIASSRAVRLRAYGLELSSGFTRGYPFCDWWLAPADDVRSSYQLEVPASEFECQGLELDWTGLCWGNDLVWRGGQSWDYRRFSGSRWQSVRDPMARDYLRNTYRVLLTRAREGLIIWVPRGNPDDATIPPHDFDSTVDYLTACGAQLLR
ncbi:DUF2075 domain-containing protein [bacterium]|nr:DUF2075 domain-containing protein [bacterium]